MESDYYVIYKRRSTIQGGEVANRNRQIGMRIDAMQLDKTLVVPYCPKLMLMFSCHLNLKMFISRVGGIKYLFQYVFKGSDRVTVQMVGENLRYD